LRKTASHRQIDALFGSRLHPSRGLRLDLTLSATAALKLDRLSRHWHMSRAQVLRVLLSQTEARVMENMTDETQDDYIIG